MLELEVQPERSLGNEKWEFLLGMPFYQAVFILKKHTNAISQIWYGPQNPLLTDLVIDLSHDGIRLIFDSRSQQLKILEVYNLSKVKLKYCSSVFNSPVIRPTTQQIDQTFGATHPGVYHPERQLFVLNFRGLSFEFKVESNCEPKYTPGLGALQFRHGASPVVSRMLIYTGNSLENTRPPPVPLRCFYGGYFLDQVNCDFANGYCRGLQFLLITESNVKRKLSDVNKITKETFVRFGDTCQDVLTALGSPSKVYFKDEVRMKIHTVNSDKTANLDRTSNYFYNYFNIGVDILFDAATHKVIKFVLHTNYPGHYDFNMYYRCRFSIQTAAARCNSPETTHRNVEVLYDTKWHSIQDLLIPQGRKPVVLNRTSSTNTTNPFGCTYCHAVRNVIFEVMQNDHIATVTIYQPNNCSSTSSVPDVVCKDTSCPV